MLIVHMDSGLGNQMLDYVEYMIIQKMNPQEDCFLEKIIYDIPNKEGMFSMWNGYELERIFGIKAPDIKEKFSEESWQRILKSVEDSEFWKEDWNYSPYIVKALEEEGMEIVDLGKRPTKSLRESKNIKDRARYLMTCFFQKTVVGYHIKRVLRLILENQLVRKENSEINLFRKYPENAFVGHSLKLKYKGFGIEKMEQEVREVFQFPPITDEKNIIILKMIENTNSVAIHARRSDLLSVNGHCYKHGYFKRAVKYIKKNVANPVFIFFTDENSIGWCEENEKIFGLDFAKDKVEFVTWNKGEDSYRDMQLMAKCKHNIFTESSFGFWGAFLNENPDKITCAPDVTIIATNTF